MDVTRSLEGEKLEIRTRQYMPGKPFKTETLGMQFRFKGGIYTEAEVTDARTAFVCNSNSGIGAGATIAAAVISGHAGSLTKPEKFAMTGGHSGARVDARKFGHARIDADLRQILQNVDLAALIQMAPPVTCLDPKLDRLPPAAENLEV